MYSTCASLSTCLTLNVLCETNSTGTPQRRPTTLMSMINNPYFIDSFTQSSICDDDFTVGGLRGLHHLHLLNEFEMLVPSLKRFTTTAVVDKNTTCKQIQVHLNLGYKPKHQRVQSLFIKMVEYGTWNH